MNLSAVSLDTPNLVREILGVTNQRALFPDKLVFRHASCQECNPRLCEDIPELSAKHSRTCQVCNYEGRGRSLKSVSYCYKHCVRTCTMVQPDIKETRKFFIASRNAVMKRDSDISKWLCTNAGLTCWEKMHQFYLPRNLFTKSVIKAQGLPLLYLNRSCTLYKVRKLCLTQSATMSLDSETLHNESEDDISSSTGISPSLRSTHKTTPKRQMHRSGVVSSPNANKND